MSGVGELLAARKSDTNEPRLIVSFEYEGRFAVVVKPDGSLTREDVSGLSVDWHYDEGEGKWMPDFKEP